MNQLRGVVSQIDSFENLSLVSVRVGQDTFSSIIINSPETESFCQEGNPIGLVFKETEVSIGKNLTGGISLRNRFRSRIKDLKHGQILTQVILQYGEWELTSVITSRSAQELNLQVGDQVEGLVKTNEVTLTR